MALVRRLLIDAQAKIRKMVEDNRQIVSRMGDESYNCKEEEDYCKSGAGRRLEQLNFSGSGDEDDLCEAAVQKKSQHSMPAQPSTTIECSTRNSSSVINKNSRTYEEMSPLTSHRYSQPHRSSSHRHGHHIALRAAADNSSTSSSSSSCNSSSGRNIAPATTATNTSDSKSGSYLVDDTNYVNRRRSRKSRRGHHPRRRADIDFQEDTEPPSPTPGPSTRNDFDETNGRIMESLNSASSLRMENDRLKAEIHDLRRLLLLHQQQNAEDADSYEEMEFQLYQDLEPIERCKALQDEVIKAKKMITDVRAELKRHKKDKNSLNNEVKRLYAALDDKDKEIREIVRSYDTKLRENSELLSIEKHERERERWSLLRHARDEAERCLDLAAQLDIKEQQLKEARRQFSAAAGYFSDQESVVSAAACAKSHRAVNGRMTPNPVNIITGLPDIGSCSVDSGVRGSSDRESAATSVAGGNLSDSTTDGTPTITIDNVHALQHRQHQRYIDADSISLISSSALPHIYQSVVTPRDCHSPSVSPLTACNFARSLDMSTLSKSVEHLGSSPPEVEPINRRNKNLRSLSGRSSVSSTWGSISRVFSRSRHRKTGSGNHDEEDYAEKLRLLREAAHVPMERWRAPTVLAWIEVALGMPQYGARCAENIKSGKVLLELNDQELDSCLRITNPMHHRKLRLAIEEYRNPSIIRYPCLAQLSHTWVCNEWLIDIGLPQYIEIFAKNMVDARMLENLTKKEMEKYLNVTRKFHQLSITQGINLLRMIKYDCQALAIRRHQCENSDTDPLVWTNQRFIQWARDIHLEEYADNLKDCGIHGAVVVLEPSFDGDMLANALEIPTSKQMIRRHLSAELEQLILPTRYEVFSQSEPIYETPSYRSIQQPHNNN